MAEAIADLVIRIGTDVEALKRDMAEVSRVTKSTADSISVSMSFAKSAISALAGSLSLGAIWSAFRSGVSELGALDDAAENAGTSVEKLGQLMADLAPSGLSLSQVSGMLQQLNRSLLQSEQHTSRAARAFQAMGIEVKNSDGSMKDQVTILREMAAQLSSYEDSADKATLMTATLGRSGAQYANALNDIGRGQSVVNRYTKEMAEDADKLDKELHRINFELRQFAVQLASDVTPPLLDFMLKMRALSVTLNSINPIEWGKFLFGPDSNINESVAQAEATVKALEKTIAEGKERIGNQKDPSFGDGLLRNLAERFNLTNDSARKQLAEAQGRLTQLREIQKVMSALGVSTAKRTPTSKELLYGPDGYGPKGAPKMKDEDAAREAERQALDDVDARRKKSADAYADAQAAIKFEIEMGLKSELSALDERKQLEADHIAQLNKFLGQEIEIKRQSDAARIDQSGIRRAATEIERNESKILNLTTEYARQRELIYRKENEAILRASVAARKSDRDSLTALEAANKAAREGNEARIQAIISGRELAEVEREIAIAKLEAELAVDERPDAEKVKRLTLLREELSLYRQRAAIEGQAARQKSEDADAARRVAQETEESAKQGANDIGRSLTDALLRGFEQGKGFAENFRDTLKNMFMTMVLRPVIEPFMKPLGEISQRLTGEIVDGLLGSIGMGKPAAPITQLTFPSVGGGELNPYTTIGRATGGPVVPGGRYIVGENGPEELYMGLSGGYVKPNARGAGGGTQNRIQTTVNLNGAGVTPQDVMSAMSAMIIESERRIAEAFSRRAPAFRR